MRVHEQGLKSLLAQHGAWYLCTEERGSLGVEWDVEVYDDSREVMACGRRIYTEYRQGAVS